ncbi:MAG TPA: response regulator [Terracidiphilus sp.]|nr:response regulator [Terracidiphilus sp.]
MISGRRNSPIVPIDEAPPADTSPYRRTVLVVDDESVIAETVAAILSQSGYAVTTAYDGPEALEIALLSPPELLITDVSLPGMTGIELAITIRRIFPDCKVLLFSGHAATAGLLAGAERAGHSFTLLSKPVHPKDLLSWVSQSLKQVSSATA